MFKPWVKVGSTWLRLALALLAVVVMVAVTVLRPPSSGTTAPAAGDYAAIDSYIEASLRSMRIPGIAFGLVHGDQVVDLKGYGVADQSGRAVTPQTPFVIGSVSKSFTALAIMEIVEAGKIDLDASVQRYVPWFRVADAAASAHITVRQLLNQTSGLSTATGNDMLVQRAGSIEEVVRRLASAKLTALPGTTWQYSNANYEVLGLLVQTVSGQSYGDYVEQHIFAPLDMKHSHATRDAAVQNGLGTGYRLWFGVPVAEPADLREEFAPAGYLVSTAEDLSHYLSAQMNGGHYCTAPCQGSGVSILSPAGITTMQTAAVPQGAVNPGQSYGMGWMQVVNNGEPVVYHEGDTQNMYAMLFMVPRLHYGAVLLANGQSLLYFLTKPQTGVAINVIGMLAGSPAAARQNLVYPIFDVLALVLLFLQARIIAGLVHRPVAAVPSALRRVVLPVLVLLFDVVVAAGALRVLPAIFDVPWTRLWRSDLGLFFLAYALAHIITAGLRLSRLLRPAQSIPSAAAIGARILQAPAAGEAHAAAEQPRVDLP